jgi:hypothetical protein
MSTRGNISFQLTEQAPARAVSSQRIDVIFETQDGIVMAVANVTAIAALSALRSSLGKTFAPGCIIIPVNTVADTVASARLWQNIADATTPVITQMTTAV